MFLPDPKQPDKHYPRLKGRGAEIKNLCTPILKVFSAARRVGNPDDAMLESILVHQRDAQDILDLHGDDVFLPVESARKFKMHIELMLRDYAKMALKADAQGELLFSTIPKHHILWHLADRAIYVNPRRVGTFQSEDLVGRFRPIVKSAASGTAAHMIASKCATKWRWGKSLYLAHAK